MKIAFFVGSADISGGTYVVFQHALHAIQEGHDVTLVLQYPYVASQRKWHPALDVLRIVQIWDLGEEHFDLAIATWWRTATELHKINADQYAYFVQSIESRFYPDAERPLQSLVDSTYDLELPVVTEATWIREHLQERHANDARLVRNGIRKDLYRLDGPAHAPRGRDLRVLVEGPFGVFFKNVGRSLKLARTSRADQTWLLTSSQLRWYPGVDRLFSRVPIDQVPAIYRSCDVIVKLSYVEGMFGPPLEMFHCGGTAIVYNVTGHDEYIRNGENALVLQRDDEAGVVNALNLLKDSPDELQRLKHNAIATAEAWPDWDTSSTQFEAVLRQMHTVPAVDRTELRERNEHFWARYVADENERLKHIPQHVSLRKRVGARLYRIRAIHDFRQWCRYIGEGWF
ncbi:TPA: glycosyltransferase family 4 protein [Stenotrophomonas maltophilia]